MYNEQSAKDYWCTQNAPKVSVLNKLFIFTNIALLSIVLRTSFKYCILFQTLVHGFFSVLLDPSIDIAPPTIQTAIDGSEM